MNFIRKIFRRLTFGERFLLFFIAIMFALNFAAVKCSWADPVTPLPGPADPAPEIELNLRDIVILTKNMKIVMSWKPEKVGHCISTLTNQQNDPKASGDILALTDKGKLHLVMRSRSNGFWSPRLAYWGKENDSWQLRDALERMGILQKILDKAIPPEYTIVLEWWDEPMTWRLYLYPSPAKMEDLKKVLKLLQTVK